MALKTCRHSCRRLEFFELLAITILITTQDRRNSGVLSAEAGLDSISGQNKFAD